MMACGGKATPTPFPDIVGGASIRAEGNELTLSGDALRENLISHIAQIPGVLRVDAYLEVTTEPNDIIGVSPGSPLQLENKAVTLSSGDWFSDENRNVAIPGLRVDSNPYGFGMSESTMVHRFEVGQSFQLQGLRLRVIGLYQAQERDLETYILLPLATAQELYNRVGSVTKIVVTIESDDKMEKMRKEVQKLLEGTQ